MEMFNAVISAPTSKFNKAGAEVEVVGHILKDDRGADLAAKSYGLLNAAYRHELEICRSTDSSGVIVIRRFRAFSMERVRYEARALARAFSKHLGVEAVVQ